jgi:hypothetical protein
MKYEADRHFLNGRLDKSLLLAPKDPKDLKKIRNRIVGMISTKAGEVLKGNTFLKYKSTLKATVEAKLKEIGEGDYDERIEGRDKMSTFCLSILTAKYRRHLQLQLLRDYTKDLLQSAGKLTICT